MSKTAERSGSVSFLDDVGQQVRSDRPLYHGEVVRHLGGKRVEMANIDQVSDGWDILQVDESLIAIDKRDPLVLAILYSQNISDRFGNL